MIAPPLPLTEPDRLAALASYRVLDTPAEPDFDDLTALAAIVTGAPVALVSLVDDTRQWFKSRRGLTVRSTPREVAFCAHAILGAEPLVVADSFADERFRHNPLAVGEPHVRSYLGAPLIDGDGHALGTLCVIDHVPRTFAPHEIEAVRRLARQAVALLDLRRMRANAAPAAAATSRFASSESHAVAACAGLRVLLADDDAVNRLLVARLLARLGCAVVIVEDGLAAVAAWRTQPFDLILMDCHMPAMDGYEATALIRGSGTPAACLPILALTASTAPEDRARGLGVGMNAILTKPIALDGLATAMHRALGRA